MSTHARGTLTAGASRKRKEREPSDGAKSQKPLVKSMAVSGSTTATPQLKRLRSNWLLAGYMAYEFLSRGTLLGKKFDPARLEESSSQPRGELEPTTYGEVAKLLRSDGAHIPGVVNPTQLARWIQM
ncbi:Embryo sac development arrest 6 [Dorcoceras hygrometricum]|uniref:Embryo sac development arrest 6 n=1 Tax=Dorcoceras hygrometricum TaxID=472368 RepID=A0A2Z7CGC7_9LAMI|nr:Embryo sac development arrest 6 [Dorcoceras hygrometricum]